MDGSGSGWVRKRLGVLLCALAIVLLAWWVLTPVEAPVELVERDAPERVVRRFAPTPPALPPASGRVDQPLSEGMFEAAAAGEHGPDLQERVCALCEAGMIDPAQCEACEDDDLRGLLIVDVIDEEGRPADRARVWVQGCAAEPGRRGEYRVGSDPCVVRAGRRDGALWAQSQSVEVAVPEGGQEYVQLEVSSQRTGGLGVSIRPADGGIRVVAVMPGTPAAELGLEPGDLIVQVDGIDTRELEMQDFIQTMTGPEGTAVDFVLEYETDTGISQEAMSIVRTFLDRS